jgi:hypothetical protein
VQGGHAGTLARAVVGRAHRGAENARREPFGGVLRERCAETGVAREVDGDQRGDLILCTVVSAWSD